MASALIRRLEVAVQLTDQDRAALQRICERSREVEPRQDLSSEGDRPEHVHLVLRGFACRYKLMANGRRQILALLAPGDFCDLHVALLEERDHSIASISNCTVVAIPRATILDLTAGYPNIARALWWATLVDEGILREWLVNLGQRQAGQRMAHFFCELLFRLRMIGVADETGFDFPLTQNDLADALALTSVHVNRTLQSLRAADLIMLNNRRLDILDLDRLQAFCGFNANYLHLMPRRSDWLG